MASSQLVGLSGGSHVSPDASLPVQRTPAREAGRKRILNCRRAGVAAQAVGATWVGPQALNVELREDGDSESDFEGLGGACEDCQRPHPAGGWGGSDREGRACAPCREAKRLRVVAHRKLLVAPVGVERRLAPILPLLRQRPHLLRRHARHLARGGLAGSCGG